MMRYREITIGLAAAAMVLALATTAPADKVTLKSGLPYDPVTVSDVSGGVIAFRIAAGSSVSKPLADVAVIELTGQDAFNQAEKLLAEGKAADAAEAYLAVEKSLADGWKKALVRYRLMAAYDAAGQFDKAVKLWLEIAQAKPDPGNLGYRPSKFPAAGSTERAKVIEMLQAELKKTPSQAVQEAIAKLLADMKEGPKAETPAAAPAPTPVKEQPATRTATQVKPAGPKETAKQPEFPGVQPEFPGTGKPERPAATERPERPGAGAPAVAGASLIRQADEAIRNNRYSDAVKLLESNVDRLSSADLPGGLYCLGKAQLELARKNTRAEEAREGSLKAGLNLMRVAVHFGASEYAPRALLAAGEVNEQLGNLRAAQAAYEAVVKNYGETEFAKAAKDAIENVKNRNKTKL